MLAVVSNNTPEENYMPNQEAIRRELENSIASARIVDEAFRRVLQSKLELGRPIGEQDLRNVVTSDVASTMASWCREAIASESTPEAALRAVHQKAMSEALKGYAKTEDPMVRAMGEYRKSIYTQYVQFTNHLFDEA